MKTRDRSVGIMLALAAAVVSGIAVFVNSYGVRALPDATVYTTAKNLVAAIVLAAIAALPRARTEAVRARLRPRQLAGLAAVAVVGGGVAFALFFEGLARASSTLTAILHKTLVIWVAVLAVALLSEKVHALQAAAIVVLVAGQAVLAGGISGLRFGTGEWLVLAATLLWSVETVAAKWLLREVPVRVVAVTRMAGGAVLLVGWVAVSGRWSLLAGIGGDGWAWATVTGLILAAYVGLWFSALAMAPAVDVTAVLVLGAVVTGLLNVVVKGAAVTPWTVSGMTIVLLGAGLAVVAATVRPAARLATVEHIE